MDVSELLEDLLSRVDDHVRGTLEGLDVDDLTVSPEPGANTIGWLLWHLARVEDAHIAELDESNQVWVEGDWATRFGFDSADPEDVGYGYTAEQVARVRPESTDAITDYYDAVRARTRKALASMSPTDLDRIVDDNWDPPVTLGVRLVSIIDDEIQHAGQAAYAKGLIERQT